MTNITFKFNQRDVKKFHDVVKATPKKFFMKVRDLWAESESALVGDIIRSQLSGRKGRRGLNRVSGNAARALNVKVKLFTRDVVSTLFLLKRGGVEKYLPIHDKSWKGSRVIKAKNKPYLVFKMQTSSRAYSKAGKRLKKPVAGFSWAKVKQVTIPERTNIIETFYKKGNPMRRRGVKKALRWAVNG